MTTNLVIGSEGVIGTSLCKFLERKKEKVIHFDIRRDVREDGRIHTFDLKLIDYVYFLAWDVGGSKYLYEPNRQLTQLTWNLKLMENVFKQLGSSKKKFLFVSSQLSEECDTVYGVTKRLGEVWTDLLGGVCVRVWNAYGIMEKGDVKSHVISDFIHQALSKKKITMMTTGEEWRQFTHIDDVCRAFYMALHSQGLRRTVYDASSYEWVRILDIAKIICDMTGATYAPGNKIGHDPLPSLNMGRIPGWLPRVELKDGIRRMVQEARNSLKNGKKK